MLASVEQGKLTEALSDGQESPLPAARVLAAGLAHRNPSYSKAMEVAAQGEMPILKRRLVVLDTIITLAPLLGLLGTITGMISSFGIMSDAGLGQPHAVTGGVAEALIATATGLLIAILTLIPYNYFSLPRGKEMEDIEYFASRMELACSRNRRPINAANRKANLKSPHRNHPDDRYDLFLLVFFMISTLSMSRFTGVQVNLPRPLREPASTETVVISLPRTTNSSSTKQLPAESLQQSLRAELTKNPELLVVINADDGVQHGKVVEIMDQARKTGATKLSIAVKPKETK
jgi:biopolymer transport protein ExbB